MFPIYRDRILMTVTGNPGTGTVTLGSAVAGYQAIPSVFDGLAVDYCIFTVDGNGNPTGQWEIQRAATYTNSGTTLSRVNTSVMDGSSGLGTLVNFNSGTQRVMLVLPADRIVGLSGNYNYLINGDHGICQRQTPGTYTNVGGGLFGADRWKTYNQASSLQYSRIDTLGALETGLKSRYYGAYKQITGSGKFMIAQILENRSTYQQLQGETVTIQLKAKSSSSKNMWAGLGYLTNSGTVDTIPGTFVSAWNANGTNPTLGTNLAYATPSNQFLYGDCGVSGNAVLFGAASGAWNQVAFTVNVPSTAYNLAVLFWPDAAFSVNDIFYLAEVGLYLGVGQREYQPRLPGQEMMLCQRYYQKSYDPETAPGTATTTGEVYGFALDTTGDLMMPVRFNQPMFKSPTVTAYSPNSGTSGKLYTASADQNALVQTAGQNGCNLSISGTTSVNFYVYGHYTAEAEL